MRGDKTTSRIGAGKSAAPRPGRGNGQPKRAAAPKRANDISTPGIPATRGNTTTPGKPAIQRKTRIGSLEARRARAAAILAHLRALYPEAGCELRHASALELLVATILSAQCTDVRVNMTTPALFARYRSAADFAGAGLEALCEIIRSTGFFRNKAKAIVALGRALVERHGGEVPSTMEELVALPGVGRKTANVILSEWFGKPGIAVDTHVIRLTGPVWRLTDETDPVKIEFALYDLIPEADRSFFGIATIFHGRRLCTARAPACPSCPVAPVCPTAHTWGRSAGSG